MTSYLYRQLTPNVLEGHKQFPVVVIAGPRQSGKTTLCRHLYPDYSYADLDDITLRIPAMENPVGFLELLGDNAVIEEVENVPELLSVIPERLAESPDRRYILTCRSSFSLSQTVSTSLADYVISFTLLPLSLTESEYIVSAQSIDRIVLGGMYPHVVVRDSQPELYYRGYYNTYVERDLRNQINMRNLQAFDRFMRLMAMRIGTEFNASALAREVGVSSVTVKEWFGILTDSYIAFPLESYHAGQSKPQTKMPKIYFYDTGLVCFLLGIDSEEKLRSHPMRGPLFENLAITELLKNRYNRGDDPSVYFYRDKSGLDIDAVVQEGDTLRLYEITPGQTIRRGFSDRIKKAKAALSGVASSTMIYEGESFPPLTLNIRDI